MSRKNLTTTITQIAILLLAGCDVASPDRPGSSTTNSPVVFQQGVDPILVIVLLAGAFVAGWFAHKRLRGGE